MKLIRVLAVDDDPDFQYLLEQTVGSQPDMELVAVCSDGSQAFQAVQRHCPDIVLMDLDLRNVGRDGAETARAIRLETASKVMILTADDDPSTVIDASVRAFASGYVFKSQFTLLLPTIRETAADILICGEKEERGPGFFGHSITAFAPMLPAGQMGFAQKKAEK